MTAVETLSLEDEHEPPMLQIIQDWFDGHLSAESALAKLDMQSRLDPNDIMLGYAAVISWRTKS